MNPRVPQPDRIHPAQYFVLGMTFGVVLAIVLHALLPVMECLR